MVETDGVGRDDVTKRNVPDVVVKPAAMQPVLHQKNEAAAAPAAAPIEPPIST